MATLKAPPPNVFQRALSSNLRARLGGKPTVQREAAWRSPERAHRPSIDSEALAALTGAVRAPTRSYFGAALPRLGPSYLGEHTGRLRCSRTLQVSLRSDCEQDICKLEQFAGNAASTEVAGRQSLNVRTF